jgi:hypothetical protein
LRVYHNSPLTESLLLSVFLFLNWEDMWAMKNLYINTLNSLSEEEQVELWWDIDKYRDLQNNSSLGDIWDVFEAY